MSPEVVRLMLARRQCYSQTPCQGRGSDHVYLSIFLAGDMSSAISLLGQASLSSKLLVCSIIAHMFSYNIEMKGTLASLGQSSILL